MSRLVELLNGPNLNLLGKRQPELYGSETLAEIEARCRALATAHKMELRCLQSNREHELIERIHDARDDAQGIIINAAAFSHSSVAILDALNAFDGPVLEVHITNIHRREPFRHHSYISARAEGVIAGFGIQGYEFALQRMAQLLDG